MIAVVIAVAVGVGNIIHRESVARREQARWGAGFPRNLEDDLPKIKVRLTTLRERALEAQDPTNDSVERPASPARVVPEGL